MIRMYDVTDFLFPTVERRIPAFGIRPGMVVVDYGCGPGRYSLPIARLVGDAGHVYAVDIHELAIEAVQRKTARAGLKNITPLLARGYASGVPERAADVVCALDMFFKITQPTPFLAELRRICKPDGYLILDDGHQPRAVTKQKLLASGAWRIERETRDHLKCRPQGSA
jgi:ubiquinone/menaquinone biosynthesis C-methylase UbiE